MQKNASDNSDYIVDYSPNENDNKIDLGQIIAILMANKWFIALITGIVLLIGTAKAFIDSPVYKTDALLQVEAQSQGLRTLEPGGVLQKNEIPVMAEVELISSRMVLEETIKNLNLDIIAKPKYFPIIGEAVARRFERNNEEKVSNALFGQTRYAWGGESIRIDTFTVPSHWLNKNFMLIAGEQGHFRLMYENQMILEGEVGKLVNKQLKDKQQSVTLLVSLLKSRPDTEFSVMRQSEDNAIIDFKKNFAVSEKGKLTRILELTLEADNPQLAVQILNEVVDIYISQNVEKKSAKAQKTLEFLEKQIPLLKAQLDEATTALNDYRSRSGSIDITIETQSILESVVKIKTEITQLQQKRDELREKFTQSHPSILAVDKQINRLQGQLETLDQKIEVLPETQQAILKLARDVNVNTELYTALLGNAQASRVEKAAAMADVRIVDYATLSTLPVKPKKALIIAVSFILGLFSSIALIFINKILFRGVEDPSLIERKLHIPIYVTIPHSVNQEKLSKKLHKSHYSRKSSDLLVLAVQNKDDLAIESLRNLRTTLHFSFLESVIMIASPSPDSGKSFVAINLAVVLADAGKKVLLIDGDMRKGFIHDILGVDRKNGLSELISDVESKAVPLLDEAIHKLPIANLNFISTGAIPNNPSELLLHKQFGHLLESISKSYDYVIINSPPVLAATDATIIGCMCGAALMVVRAGHHPMQDLEQSTKRLTQAGVHLKGVVFNDLPESSYEYNKYAYHYHDEKSN
jgi:tyrosine-protein kinase Etk/Wzc